MPDPIPFMRPRPTKPHAPTTAGESCLTLLSEFAEIGMEMTCRIVNQIERQPESSQRWSDLQADLLRTTLAVQKSIMLRNRLTGRRSPQRVRKSGEPVSKDFRQLLYRLADIEADPASRARLRRCIDAELRAEPP